MVSTMVDFFSMWGENYILISVLVVGISAALVAIIYQLGRILQDKKMSEWAKQEFYQVFASLVIIALVFFAITSINTILLSLIEKGEAGSSLGFKCFATGCYYEEWELTQGSLDPPKAVAKVCTQHCHMELAKSYLNSTFNVVRYYAAAQIGMAGWITLLSDTELNLGVFLKSGTLAPLSGCALIDQTFEWMIDTMFTLMGVIKGNWIMLNLVEYAIFPLFLIWGIILRILPITRKLGGLLIAMALVLYFFYPAFIILEGIMLSPQEQLMQMDIPDFPKTAPMLGTTNEQGQWKPELNTFLTVKDPNGQSYGLCPYNGWSVTRPGGIIDTTAAMTVWVALQFIILIYLVAMTITELSPIFGGDVDIAGISKLL